MDDKSMGETSKSGMCQVAHPLLVYEGIKSKISENNRGYWKNETCF